MGVKSQVIHPSIDSAFRFNHVEKFAELANKLYSIRKSRFDRTPPPVAVLRELGQTTKLPGVCVCVYGWGLGTIKAG